MNKNIIILGAAFLILWGVATSGQPNGNSKAVPKNPINCPDGKCPIKQTNCDCVSCRCEREGFPVVESYIEAMSGCLNDGKPCLVFVGGIQTTLVDGLHHTKVETLFDDPSPRVALVVSQPGDNWPKAVLFWRFTPTPEQVRQGVNQYGYGKSAIVRPVSGSHCGCSGR